MRPEEELRATLARIDRRGYKAYRDVEGAWVLGDLELHVDRVQSDPFAAPSRVRLRLSQAEARLPDALFSTRVRRVALEDFLARSVRTAIGRNGGRGRGSGKSGILQIDAGGQEVLERTALRVTPAWVEARLEVGLPAAGRSVLGREAERLLCDTLPRIARALRFEAQDPDEARHFVECVENQEALRESLAQHDLLAFVADGSILPRESGASDRPLREDAVPFQAPAGLAVELEVPNPVAGAKTTLRGLAIRRGVTLIVGGGYHGKSTLLRALERGVQPHVPGDGREYVVTAREVVKIRAEDGRAVTDVDISPFVDNLPQGRSTKRFHTDDASGSTSQAANIVEALEVGATGLLLDEDTSATNFMVRDARMQALVAKEREPITPFLDRVRELHERQGVSSVLVMGGSGDYFDAADQVIAMDAFLPHDVTEEARRVAKLQPTQRRVEAASPFEGTTARAPLAEAFDASRGRRDIKIDARSLDLILYGRDEIDLRGVEQIVDRSQTRAIGHAIHLATRRWMDGRRTLREVVEALDAYFEREGLDGLDPFRRGERHPGSYARPRPFEIAAAINRMRRLRIASPGDDTAVTGGTFRGARRRFRGRGAGGP